MSVRAGVQGGPGGAAQLDLSDGLRSDGFESLCGLADQRIHGMSPISEVELRKQRLAEEDNAEQRDPDKDEPLRNERRQQPNRARNPVTTPPTPKKNRKKPVGSSSSATIRTMPSMSQVHEGE